MTLSFAGTGDDYIVGGAGNDVIEGGAGADILFGGDGLDWASYASSPEGIALRLWNGRGNGGHATGDELSGIENLVGSGFDDLLVGDQFDNYLRVVMAAMRFGETPVTIHCPVELDLTHCTARMARIGRAMPPPTPPLRFVFGVVAAKVAMLRTTP
jgi:hypothetical protein